MGHIAINKCRDIHSIPRMILSAFTLCAALASQGCADASASQGATRPAPEPIVSRAIRVGGDQGYPPFEFLTEDGEPSGFNIDIVTSMADALGLSVDISLSPWSEARARLERGDVDLLAGMYKDPERDLSVDFSMPIFISSYGVFALKGSDIRSGEDIANKRIAVQKGDLGHEYLAKNGIGSSLVVVDDWEEIFRAVIRGDADCAVCSVLQGARAIKDRNYAQLRSVGKPILRTEYCMAVREGDDRLLATINEGIGILRANGEYDRIYSAWFGQFERSDVDERIVGALAAILAIAITVGVSSLIWSLALSAKVTEKTRQLTVELKHSSDAKARLQAALNEASEAKAAALGAVREESAFIACVSHELRTPLHGILGATELLGKTALDDEQRKTLSMARASAEQLNRMLSDLLDAIGAEKGALRIEPAEFSYAEFAAWIESVLRSSAEDRGLAFRFTMEGDERRLFADKNRIAQVIMNLCTNAIKYTERGDVELDLKLGADSLAIAVKDTGPGIPEDSRDNIFKPFYRADRAEKNLPEGLGLGLSIVKGIVDAMGGTIHFDTHPSMGTRFDVVLPLAPTSDSRSAAPEIQAPPPVASIKLARGNTRGRAIIAEDEAINRIYLTRILEAAGYETRQAADGATALEAAGEGEWDFILMDVSMPRMDGLEATRRIRSLESSKNTRRIPIVALTAHAYAEDRLACVQAGMDGFLSKPFTEAALWQEVTRTIAAMEPTLPQ